jgi:D-aspartate ligase
LGLSARRVELAMNTQIPAFILNAEAHGGLGIARSLGRLGVPVFVAHRSRFAPARLSRYVERGYCWDFASASEDQSLAFLRRAAREIGKPALLFSCDDATATFVANHADTLNERFLIPTPSGELVADLASKRGLSQLAARHGVPAPDAWFPESETELLSMAKGIRYPVLLKGIDGLKLARRTGHRMVICRDFPDLLARYESLEDAEQPNLMLQEYIPGGSETVWMFNGYFNARSECLASFTGKKLRQCPIRTGATSLGICLENETVESTMKRFMSAVGYRGMLDVGMRYDARDCRYKVLDVNPRIGATFRLFTGVDGMDVARACYLDMTGQRVPPTAAREGRKWIVEDMDASATAHLWLEGSLTVRAWLKSLRGIDEAAYLAADDPLPAVARAFSFAGLLGLRALRKALRGSSATGSASKLKKLFSPRVVRA